MELVKSYRIPVEAPKDLIEGYFTIKKRALNAIFSHVKTSKKAHLDFKSEARRELRDKLLKDWRFS
ncbi:transposase, partial [Candidatus Bathyarchaeota archaeon]|nr:transposase [Candidatus Bathyarchaeota archaeon]